MEIIEQAHPKIPWYQNPNTNNAFASQQAFN
jgi:hypothetical protein